MAADSTRVVAGRDFKVWEKDWASANALPNDSVDWGASIAGYSDMGYTVDGLHWRAGVTRTDIRVDQELDPVFRVPTARDLGVSTSLAQLSAANLKAATGMGAIETVAAVGASRGHDDLVIGSTVTEQYKTIIFDIRNPGDSEAMRLMIKKGLAVGQPTMDFTVEAAAVIALDIAALPDTSVDPTHIATFRDVIAAPSPPS